MEAAARDLLAVLAARTPLLPGAETLRPPMTAPFTSTPSVVRFSPKSPLASRRLSRRLPPVVVLPRVRVNGPIVAAVVLDVEDLITD